MAEADRNMTNSSASSHFNPQSVTHAAGSEVGVTVDGSTTKFASSTEGVGSDNPSTTVWDDMTSQQQSRSLSLTFESTSQVSLSIAASGYNCYDFGRNWLMSGQGGVISRCPASQPSPSPPPLSPG